jgi:hypothetical protein
MPPVKQSARPNLDGWRPAETPLQQEDNNQVNAPEPDPTERSPYMLTSMPLMASTGDAFQRQFYSRASTPSQRILPAKRGGGA